MDWLNYHHLLYFWLVAREGGVTQAANKLSLAHPTVSAQIRSLERALGEKLFERQGRRLVLTEMGKVVYGYAEEIFALGQELMDAMKGRPTGRPFRLAVGISEVVPKLIAKRLLDPARSVELPVRLVCIEDKTERLLTELATHNLDVLITDSPVLPGSSVRAYDHLLGECGVSVLATKDLARRHRPGFPRSLESAPMLLPTDGSALRRALNRWFDENGLSPIIEAEFDDSALAKVFAQDGAGLFVAPTPIEKDVCQQHGLALVGRLPEVRERFYAITAERKLRHPAVAAISRSARKEVFKDLPKRRE